jgi:hypothetical protein
VIAFDNPALFCIGKDGRDNMGMNREISFAVIACTYTILAFP